MHTNTFFIFSAAVLNTFSFFKSTSKSLTYFPSLSNIGNLPDAYAATADADKFNVSAIIFIAFAATIAGPSVNMSSPNIFGFFSTTSTNASPTHLRTCFICSAAVLNESFSNVIYPTTSVPLYIGILRSTQSLIALAIEPSIGPIVLNACVTFANLVLPNPRNP